ncbi:MAG: hypothetical protein LBT51_07320 [Fusobacteriaceae bacterium]|jgi:hypothetical protein|nr:hypothetical protein [Fusobacteriaceae bacterium]
MDDIKGKLTNKDNGGCLWALLGIFFPYVGVVLWFLWKKESPKTAESIGKGSLITILFLSIFVIIFLGLLFLNNFIKSI